MTDDSGPAQREGGPIKEIRPGNIVWFPPRERHWHGAAPAIAMTHIAIAELLDGQAVVWPEKVSDEQYRGQTNKTNCGFAQPSLDRQLRCGTLRACRRMF